MRKFNAKFRLSGAERRPTSVRHLLRPPGSSPELARRALPPDVVKPRLVKEFDVELEWRGTPWRESVSTAAYPLLAPTVAVTLRHSRGWVEDRPAGRPRPRVFARAIFTIVFLFALGASARGGIAIDLPGETVGLGLLTLAGLAAVTLVTVCFATRGAPKREPVRTRPSRGG